MANDVGEGDMRKPMRIVVGVVGVLGRILLCTVFLAAALGYTVPDVHGFAQVIAAKGAIAPTWVLVGAVALLVVGSLSVVVGYKARLGALTLLAFLAPATCYIHGFTFWSLVNSQARHDHVVCLATNLSIMGAMLFIVANGAGKMSLDGKGR
jgi:putative oxidoreductase